METSGAESLCKGGGRDMGGVGKDICRASVIRSLSFAGDPLQMVLYRWSFAGGPSHLVLRTSRTSGRKETMTIRIK